VEERELVVETDAAGLPATLSLPDVVRAGVVSMHPAISPDRNYFMLAHLAKTLPAHGIALLRYDRRPSEGIDDVPFAAQAADALRAIGQLHEQIGGVPIGLWAYSQGTWGATLAAAQAPDDVAFLALVAAQGVSPVEQMRYGTSEQLRRGGYGADALDELKELRTAVEDFLRHEVDLASAQATISRFKDRAWFPLTYYPTELPADATWQDMDFAPAPVISLVQCPVLLVYGEEDEWTPVEPSLLAWRSARHVTVEILPRRGHAPVVDDTGTLDSIDPAYERRLLSWLAEVVGERA
jgi:uncharacterized protein